MFGLLKKKLKENILVQTENDINLSRFSDPFFFLLSCSGIQLPLKHDLYNRRHTYYMSFDHNCSLVTLN
jgi:hypothetical protein